MIITIPVITFVEYVNLLYQGFPTLLILSYKTPLLGLHGFTWVVSTANVTMKPTIYKVQICDSSILKITHDQSIKN